MALENQDIGPFFPGEDAKFDAIPVTAGSIDLNALSVFLKTGDGATTLKTLTVANGGVTVNGTTNIRAIWDMDSVDAGGNLLFPPGRYQYEVRITTVGSRKVVAVGGFPVETKLTEA